MHGGSDGGASGEGDPADADSELPRAAASRQAKSVSPVQRRLGRPARDLSTKSLELGGKEGRLRVRAGRRSAEEAQREAKLVCSVVC